jgi:hypothetical protein
VPNDRGIVFSWKVCAGVSLFFLIVSGLSVGVVLLEQFALHSAWNLKRLSTVIGLIAALVCLPVPFVALRRSRQQFSTLLPPKGLEGTQFAAAESSMALTLLLTYSAIEALVLALVHVIQL